MGIRIFRTTSGIYVESEGIVHRSGFTSWDQLINSVNLYKEVNNALNTMIAVGNTDLLNSQTILPPLESQEVWAAGVTYLKSRDARMEESKDAGGGSFYDKVYEAERPEIFFKATPHRCIGMNGKVRIRRDSSWDVPEPELTLVINYRSEIVGYTIGNDMSSRSIEGENPLYLPQAKTYDGSAAIGPCIYLSEQPISPDSMIKMEINRDGKSLYKDEVAISQMKRKHQELVDFLYRECSFPQGALLMTGTCLVPSNEFTLSSGDEIIISIDHIGVLKNYVE